MTLHELATNAAKYGALSVPRGRLRVKWSRGAETANANRARLHMTQSLGDCAIASLTAHDLETWRNKLLEKMVPASVNRVCHALRAALNLTADGIENQSRAARKTGLRALPDASNARNVVISEAEVRRIVLEASRESPEFGLLVELAAATGARYVQLCRLQVRDLKADYVDMPSSKKGKGKKKITHRQIPISSTLVDRLRTAAAGKAPSAPLLTRPDGAPWGKSDQTRPFGRTVVRARLDPNVVTINALRHTDICRMINDGTPTRIIAVLHDTSVTMIERNYSLHIDKHVDHLVRPKLLDFGPAAAEDSNIASLAGRR